MDELVLDDDCDLVVVENEDLLMDPSDLGVDDVDDDMIQVETITSLNPVDMVTQLSDHQNGQSSVIVNSNDIGSIDSLDQVTTEQLTLDDLVSGRRAKNMMVVDKPQSETILLRDLMLNVPNDAVSSSSSPSSSENLSSPLTFAQMVVPSTVYSTTKSNMTAPISLISSSNTDGNTGEHRILLLPLVIFNNSMTSVASSRASLNTPMTTTTFAGNQGPSVTHREPSAALHNPMSTLRLATASMSGTTPFTVLVGAGPLNPGAKGNSPTAVTLLNTSTNINGTGTTASIPIEAIASMLQQAQAQVSVPTPTVNTLQHDQQRQQQQWQTKHSTNGNNGKRDKDATLTVQIDPSAAELVVGTTSHTNGPNEQDVKNVHQSESIERLATNRTATTTTTTTNATSASLAVSTITCPAATATVIDVIQSTSNLHHQSNLSTQHQSQSNTSIDHTTTAVALVPTSSAINSTNIEIGERIIETENETNQSVNYHQLQQNHIDPIELQVCIDNHIDLFL